MGRGMGGGRGICGRSDESRLSMDGDGWIKKHGED